MAIRPSSLLIVRVGFLRVDAVQPVLVPTRDVDDRASGRGEEEHEGMRNRHATRRIPGDAVLLAVGAVQHAGGGDGLIKGARVREARLLEEIAAGGKEFDRAIDRNPILLAVPAPGVPDRGVKVQGVDGRIPKRIIQGRQHPLVSKPAKPGHVDRHDVGCRRGVAQHLIDALVKLWQRAQVETALPAEVVAEIRPHVAHRDEVIVVVQEKARVSQGRRRTMSWPCTGAMIWAAK